MSDGWPVVGQWNLVLGFLNRAPYRLQAQQIRGDGRRILVRQFAIDRDRHWRANDRPVWTLAVAQSQNDIGFGPFTYPGIRVGRDVWRDDMSGKVWINYIEYKPASQCHGGMEVTALGVPCMAVATCTN